MTNKLKNDRLLRALKRQPVDRTPVWIMRQAGRYLPEYRQIRSKAGDFLTLCKTPELACEVTLQPINRFALDAAILFSDILTIPDAMGLGLSLNEGVGPRFARPVRSAADIDALPPIDPAKDLGYVIDAIRLVQRELDGRLPLIGFSGSPWTLATYMVEGGGNKDFRYAKGLLYQDPVSAHKLLAKNTTAVIDYLRAQAAAGAQALMIFDTWGGVLSTPAYLEFSLAYMTRIVYELKQASESRDLPLIVFTKGGGLWLEQIAASGCDAVGLDWTMPLSQARQRIGDKVALQGNMDPIVLFADADQVRAETRRIMQEFGSGSGHIFNLGHGIHRSVNPDNVAALIDEVHQFSVDNQP